ncbi:uncharacterized protein SPPG_09492 [Spizellomyces punctatus DAOM BR117]|uniref:Uncharacterized protein n=1 Tax=Spizellomyces punctatus (strain DAOM BR117) TaxID=645134 RepID=A0A0L0H876_SPIPD|nr:uncharacterized protein SPPG_09492 [Spizellomyces punctatus DAOM BR117]KNC96898.1 hypothetical protein SPPG_09492 [Spizellomyces punctatus DAOM BR117]|eukprot:XP_016604938.1 hypothetical protein SPPG_09492 [Spizellomyces punctatus DAOM BR117]
MKFSLISLFAIVAIGATTISTGVEASPAPVPIPARENPCPHCAPAGPGAGGCSSSLPYKECWVDGKCWCCPTVNGC